MSISDKMTGLADAVRNVSSTAGKLDIDDMKNVVSQLGSFHDFGAVADGTDANDFTHNGMYRINDQTLYKNIPESFGVLVTFAPDHENAYILQLYATASNNLYYRTKNGGFGWGSWNRLGGVISPVLSAFKQVAAPLMGGVAYVA